MTPPATSSSLIDRLPTGVRLVLLILVSTLALFTLAFGVGYVVGYMDVSQSGFFGPYGLGVLLAILVVAGLLLFLSWRLSAYWRDPSRSSFDKRYSRMWLILFALGLPAGILLGEANDQAGVQVGDLFHSGPIEPRLAIITAAVLLVILVVTAILYHRTIDAHEEHAYLWASTGALYFLAAAMPTAWLLDRGGLIGPFGLGLAMLLLLAAFLVQCLIWAWLKFR